MMHRVDRETLRRAPPSPLAPRAPSITAPTSPPATDDAALLARATRLLADELGRTPAAIIALVDHALARFPGAREVAIHAHPDDLALLGSAAALAARHALDGTPVLVPAPTFTRGGCRIVSAGGELDARVETRVLRALAAGEVV